MQITLELPEDIARGLACKWNDLPRAAAEIRRLLGFETRIHLDAFLKDHGVFDYTASDFEQDREVLRNLRIRGPGN